MTVSEAIAEPLLIQKVFSKKQKVELKNRVEELMELVGLAKRLVKLYPHELDGGRRTENWNCKSACAESEICCMR